ncbi:hypothetical protein FHS18_002470 [Paenibacillus phyllosphaerae]|uniref:Spo0E like sporulation regulatory protein n=1 Tax=Paenibacillus phyllosphaerae TaxID=274593 RepID=A0A7W5AX34_9BACL|nr:hypothetical protein [Paenibacillus phyllosphaerae]
MNNLADLNHEIERLRLLLNGYMSESSLTHPRILELSQKLDKLIVKHYRLASQLKSSPT